MSSTTYDYIYEEDFLDPKTCHLLVTHLQQTLDTSTTQNSTNQNRLFDNRVVYWESTHKINPQVHQIMKIIHERVSAKLKDFYNLDTPLYPEATHLVKWPEGTSLGEHADNAYSPSGKPNYVHWRTHSAIIYLNDNYEGGEFYFKRNLPHTLKPKTGLLVGFTGGMDHVHGVHQVTSGTRYAMPMWFTQDPKRAYPQYRPST